MNRFIQPGFFDLQDRYDQLSQSGDPLERLDKVMEWKQFLPLINRAFDKARKSPAGRKPYNRLMMFKVLVLQSLYNLSDHQVEFQIRDRLSFMRFLELSLHEKIPDEKTLWTYREVLVTGGVIQKLFQKFNHYLERQGFAAKGGSLIDATLVEVPRQRNSRDENAKIKEGKIPNSWQEQPDKLRHKDVDARWVKKNNESYYGYKNHVNADVIHKLIRCYEITAASTGDVKMLESLLPKWKDEKKIWADSAYYSGVMEEFLKRNGFISRIMRRYESHQPLGSAQERENRRRAKIRKRVEHIFGFMENSMGGKFIRTIGLLRAKAKIGLMNLVYNFSRYEQLCRSSTP